MRTSPEVGTPDGGIAARTQQTTVHDAEPEPEPEPEGTLVFGSNRNTGSLAQLYTKDLATGVATGITDIQNYLEPAWSPDGTRIAAFWGDRLHVMDADGANRVEYDLLNLFDIVGAGGPTWSADGMRIAFHGVFDFDAQQDRDLWVLDVTTDQVTRITDNTVQDEYPAWSADGTRIAYTVNGQDLITLYCALADGSGAAQVLEALINFSTLDVDWK